MSVTVKKTVLFVSPLILWLCLFWPFISGQVGVNGDTQTNYALTKFFWNNILNGVWPLWDPFVYLGRPFIGFATSGVLNPLSLLIPLQVLCGIDYYHAYLVYLVVFFFVGALGFFCLVRELFKDEAVAFAGYILFLFSGLAPMVFMQINILLVAVPGIWFFYYALCFLSRPSRLAFLGLTFWAMMVLVSYLPFYFLTVVCLAVFLIPVLCWRSVIPFFSSCRAFMGKERGLVLLAAAGILISAMPLAFSSKMIDTAVFISPSRHSCNLYETDPDKCPRGLEVSFANVAVKGSLGERVSPRDFFTHFDKRSYVSDDFYYVPVAAYFVMFLGLVLLLDRIRLLLFLMGTAVFFISLGWLTPLFKGFLYLFPMTYVFRNLFFYLAFLIPLLLLFSLGQMRALLDISSSGKILRKAAAVVALTIAFLVLYRHFDDVLLSTWLTLVGGGILAVGHCLRAIDVRRGAGLFLLCTFLLIEPVEVFYKFTQPLDHLSCQFPAKHVRPQFSFIRPLSDSNCGACALYLINPYRAFWYDMALQDNLLGFPPSPDLVSADLVRFSFSLNPEEVQRYLKHKFLLYDRPPADLSAAPVVFVKDASTGIQPRSFSVNSLSFETNFSKKYFLVYNDNYDKHWKAYIDGKPTDIIRTNQAFKGIFIDAGRHLVKFVYSPTPGSFCMWMILGYIYGFFFLYAYNLIRNERPGLAA